MGVLRTWLKVGSHIFDLMVSTTSMAGLTPNATDTASRRTFVWFALPAEAGGMSVLLNGDAIADIRDQFETFIGPGLVCLCRYRMSADKA